MRPALGHLQRIVGDPVDAIALEAAGRIGAHALAPAPAKQHGDGGAIVFALDIPERDIDAGKGGNRKPALPLIAQRVVEDRPELFRLARVLADQPGRVRRNHRRIRPRRAEALAPADRAVVALDLDQHMGATVKTHGGAFERHGQPMFEKVGADGDDLHGLSSQNAHF